ncbi:hypothetical protein Nepgr_024095 [Nepenthes gracilis]|uniref:Uncharacterized protein n=1 Tax=Nepenthes gracilis TaxID=150966 RepID=A0AAD3T405_NEPGR|nr:hypothetical protein Nepgr_024095 [Nepenthes gracilis]
MRLVLAIGHCCYTLSWPCLRYSLFSLALYYCATTMATSVSQIDPRSALIRSIASDSNSPALDSCFSPFFGIGSAFHWLPCLFLFGISFVFSPFPASTHQ